MKKYCVLYTFAAIIIFGCSACNTVFSRLSDYVTNQNKAKVIKLFSYYHVYQILQDSTLLGPMYKSLIIEDTMRLRRYLDAYKCMANNPTIEDEFFNIYNYTITGSQVRESLPHHDIILSCPSSNIKMVVTFYIEFNKWLVWDIDKYPRPSRWGHIEKIE